MTHALTLDSLGVKKTVPYQMTPGCFTLSTRANFTWGRKPETRPHCPLFVFPIFRGDTRKGCTEGEDGGGMAVASAESGGRSGGKGVPAPTPPPPTSYTYDIPIQGFHKAFPLSFTLGCS